ncbi:MAG: hypothetical protein K0S86_5468, partial [Geminicoccaceae bacterium]|nr:hypothetical protein [Geminicoccaceae bacterium]
PQLPERTVGGGGAEAGFVRWRERLETHTVALEGDGIE